MRLTEIADMECCDVCGDYFDAADTRGALCPSCSKVEEDVVVVENCQECGTRIEEYGNICTGCVTEVSIELKNEAYTFDKFIDSIVIAEQRKNQKVDSDTPMRERIKRHQEKPLNRTKY